ncbi:hypothetical protein C7N43_38285 [Sphingobacteriales bacterium UPWRP_1]|nr:hypothetical protein C7N43_38285 [Sphingobacteriales bacterium UPWRP_1]
MEQDNTTQTITAEEVAIGFIFPIWRCLNADIKQKYGADTWGMFENFVRTSASQPSLQTFLEKMKRLIKIEFRVEEQKQVLEFIQNAPAQKTLTLLRTQPSYIILIVRDANTQLKEGKKQQSLNPISQQASFFD